MNARPRPPLAFGLALLLFFSTAGPARSQEPEKPSEPRHLPPDRPPPGRAARRPGRERPGLPGRPGHRPDLRPEGRGRGQAGGIDPRSGPDRLKEYLNETVPNDKAAIEGEIALAEAELAKMKGRVEEAERQAKKGDITDQELLSKKFALQKAEFALKQTKTSREVLGKYTKEKRSHPAGGPDQEGRRRPRREAARRWIPGPPASRRWSAGSPPIPSPPASVGSSRSWPRPSTSTGQGREAEAKPKLDQASRIARDEEAKADALFGELSARIKHAVENPSAKLPPPADAGSFLFLGASASRSDGW